MDPNHAKSAVRRLFQLGRSTGVMRAELQEADEHHQPLDISVARAEVVLMMVGNTLEDAIADWTDIHEEALKQTMQELNEEKRQASE